MSGSAWHCSRLIDWMFHLNNDAVRPGAARERCGRRMRQHSGDEITRGSHVFIIIYNTPALLYYRLAGLYSYHVDRPPHCVFFTTWCDNSRRHSLNLLIFDSSQWRVDTDSNSHGKSPPRSILGFIFSFQSSFQNPGNLFIEEEKTIVIFNRIELNPIICARVVPYDPKLLGTLLISNYSVPCVYRWDRPRKLLSLACHLSPVHQKPSRRRPKKETAKKKNMATCLTHSPEPPNKPSCWAVHKQSRLCQAKKIFPRLCWTTTCARRTKSVHFFPHSQLATLSVS